MRRSVRRANVQVLDLMRRQPFVAMQLDEVEMVARGGINRVKRRLPKSAVVGVVEAAIAEPEHRRVACTDGVWLLEANQADKIAAKLQRWREFAVRVAQEDDLFQAERGCGIALLNVA